MIRTQIIEQRVIELRGRLCAAGIDKSEVRVSFGTQYGPSWVVAVDTGKKTEHFFVADLTEGFDKASAFVDRMIEADDALDRTLGLDLLNSWSVP